MGIKNLPGLFIRESYLKLFDLFADPYCELFEQRSPIILTGNPGTGKTLFGFYMMYRYMKEGISFVYESTFTGDELWVCTNGEFTRDKRQVVYRQHDKSATHIFDGKQVDITSPFRKVLICSPRRHFFNNYDKLTVEYFYMPIWSQSEIEACRERLFPTLSKNLVDSLYQALGGIPRYLLKRSNDKWGNDHIYAYLIIKFFYNFIGAFSLRDFILL